MAFDGGFLHKITAELSAAEDSHVDKIYQPSKDELVFLLRKKGFVKKLLITARPGYARLHFTEGKYENPQTPPMFCMLMRKYLSAARLLRVTQPALERIAELTFSASNELGDIIELRLIAEFLGNKTNIILVGADGRIIDSLRRSDPERDERMLLPGAVYKYHERQNKLNPLTVDLTSICNAVERCGEDREKALLITVEGFSPLICRETAYRADKCGDFKAALESVLSDLKAGGTPLLLFKKDGTPFDFTYTDIGQYGNEFEKREYDSYSGLLDAFYSARENAERVRHAAADIIKLVNNLKNRTEKKLSLRLCDLKKCENREKLRIYGELLKANLYRLKNGARFAEVENYYDDMKTVKIPLDPSLSVQKNAAKYFKDYKKSYTAEQMLTRLTEKDREELIYFDSVLDSIARSKTAGDIAEIREELAIAGYVKKQVKGKKKTQPPKFQEYVSAEGYKILVGKNNSQNDYLTTSLAAKNDLWFHVKNIPGSHVIVFSHGNEVSDRTVLQAARLAAQNSKAADSSNTAVDYTPVKYVKKPNGAKPGMVIYTTNKTVYVTPDTRGEIK